MSAMPHYSDRLVGKAGSHRLIKGDPGLASETVAVNTEMFFGMPHDQLSYQSRGNYAEIMCAIFVRLGLVDRLDARNFNEKLKQLERNFYDQVDKKEDAVAALEAKVRDYKSTSLHDAVECYFEAQAEELGSIVYELADIHKKRLHDFGRQIIAVDGETGELGW